VFSTAATISVGDGDGDVVTGDEGIVTMGNGNNDVFNAFNTQYHAPGVIVTLGNGNGDVVNDTGGRNDAITVGNGNDTIYVGHNDTVTVGTGHDSFVFQQIITTTLMEMPL
jgi:Ca2+-binding RTX toxin-like protein